MMAGHNDRWWKAEKGRVHSSVRETVRQIENNQGDVYDRLERLEALYDPNSPDNPDSADANVTENAIASNVDTVTAVVAATEIRAAFETDGADWGQQRTARALEWYAEEQVAKLEVLPKCRGGFKEAAKKGNGLCKVTAVDDAPDVHQVFVENIVVNQDETRDGRTPLHMHEWVTEDADVLAARYPKFEKEIEKARRSKPPRGISTYRIATNDVVYLDSYRLPIGKPDMKGRYLIQGRHTVTIDGADLLDEPYNKTGFPYSGMVWSERAKSWFGISGAERIMGIQRALNRRNWTIERGNDQVALPTTYVRPADAELTVKSNRVGAMAVVRGEYPKTVTPVAVSAETYQSRIDLRNSANEEFGQTTMATHGAKPPGIDSGVAMREFKDQTTQRFATQEEAFERFVLDTILLVLDVCKDLGKKAPVAMRHTRFGVRKLKWSDVDMGDVKVQIKAASNLSRTPAGRVQFVMELAQAGVISTDKVQRLLQHPDVEEELSLYTAALESIEHGLDEIADGRQVMPEPFTNLEMAVWRGQQEYLKWTVNGAPETRLESLRQFIVQAAFMLDAKEAANQNVQAGAGAPPMPGAMPALPGPPAATQPVAALSPQAMQLRAG